MPRANLQEKFKVVGGIKVPQRVRIVLSIEDKLNYLEKPLPLAPVALEGQQVALEIIAVHNEEIKDQKRLLENHALTMEPEIQQNLENIHANDMLKELKTLQSRAFGAPCDTWPCSESDFDRSNLRKIDLVLVAEFNNMHSPRKPVNELHAMLKLYEQTLPKNNAPALHVIRTGDQNQRKLKNGLLFAPKPKFPPPPKGQIPKGHQTVMSVLRQTLEEELSSVLYAESRRRKRTAASKSIGSLSSL
ncbi:hypothetical protein Tco_1243851 [Tanacetum coccineum]